MHGEAGQACLPCFTMHHFATLSLHHGDMFFMHRCLFLPLKTSFHQASHSDAYATNAFLDEVFFGGGEAEAELLLTASINVEGFADDEGYMLFGGFAE